MYIISLIVIVATYMGCYYSINLFHIPMILMGNSKILAIAWECLAVGKFGEFDESSMIFYLR